MSRLQRWDELATVDFAGFDPLTTAAVLPLAATEQHGPHLPLATDAIIADALLEAAAALVATDVPLLRLPTQRIGHSPEHAGFSGTLTLPAETLLAAWTEIGRGVHAAGVRKLLVLNTHGGQSGLVDVVAVRLRGAFGMTVVRYSYHRLPPPAGLIDARERRFGLHGGLIETSLLLHIAPDLVRGDRLANFRSAAEPWEERHPHLPIEADVGVAWCAEDLNAGGATGDAAAASAALGAQLLAHNAQRLARTIEDLQRCPLLTDLVPDPPVGSRP
jgi:creatinine amidohydrolase